MNFLNCLGYLLIVGITCLIEWLVSIPFGMHKECAKLILITRFRC